MYRLIVMSVVTALAVAFAAGCGSGEDEAESAPLTKAQFVKQADAICKKTSEEREQQTAAWRKENGSGEAIEEVDYDALFKEVVAPSLRSEVEQLKALVPPEAEEAEVARAIGSLSEISKILEEENSEQVSQSISKFQSEADAYGLSNCL